jgi:methanethiol S-methyltransferase
MDPFLRLSTVAALWVAWCAIHSLLNNDGPIGGTALLRGPFGRFYRIFYNLLAIASLVLVCNLIPHKHEVMILQWRGPLVAVQAVVWAAAFFIGYLSFRLFNVWTFLGLDIFRKPRTVHVDKGLVTWGIHGVIRHPQFLGGLMLLWTRNLADTDLVTNTVLSLYLLAGAKVEERRMLKKYGDQYSEYKSHVPAFLPTSLSALRAVIGQR